jgi:hypothetical protein
VCVCVRARASVMRGSTIANNNRGSDVDETHLDLDIVDGLLETQNRTTNHRREDGSWEVSTSETTLDKL